LDGKKWPFKMAAPEDSIIFPREIKNVLEDFTKMYEKVKRVSQEHQTKKKDDKQPQAILLSWDVRFGNCELETWSLADPHKSKFTITMTCVHGLILLNLNSH